VNTKNSDYREAKRELDGVVRAGFQLSKMLLGRPSANSREHLAATYLAKINLGVLSFTKLLPVEDAVPHGADELDASQFCDISSLASLCRNLIEAANRLFYFCIEAVSEHEFSMRIKIHEYHAVHGHLGISKKVGLNPKRVAELEADLDGLKSELEQMPSFAALKKEVKNHILMGRWGEALTQPEIAEKRGRNRLRFLADFKFLSSHIHSDSYSLFDVRMRSMAGGVMTDELREFTSNLIKEVTAYYASVLLDLSGLFTQFRLSTEGIEKLRAFAARLN
jgi:hypothetical protein